MTRRASATHDPAPSFRFASLRVTLAFVVQLLWFVAPGSAQDPAQDAVPPAPVITELRVEQEGQPLDRPEACCR